jgi:predicted ATPase/class 3 adenylate cyclase
VTFVFTDIEGSTQRWERDRVAMQSALRRHDELMRAALVKHGGYVFKTIGDAFCAAFGRAEDAIAAVHDAQHALAAEDFSAVDGLRVRAAIHTGTSDERDGDYYGPAVNRVARLLAIGHGGQVLVSGVAADLVQGALPPQASLRDLGEHRLRDLARPEYVYQLLAPGLASEFPPLRSLDARSNNLPLQLKSFVGREREIAEITALIEKHRLVTLVGSGGVGKTRTSLQIAANLLDGSGDGVWFIELAPLVSGDYIPSTVARVLGLTLPSDGDHVANLAALLKGKRALLVFDNCEHMVEPAARVVAAILRACPHIKILASSRQGLGIEGEETYRMPSLDIPSEAVADTLTAAEALKSTAIVLFAERALTVNKRFTLTDKNAPFVADICRRLDGIPLAIELAAARVQILSPRQLHERLDERFRVLTGGNRDVLPRQQTLRALIDWSHDLLDERERTLFRRLAIFVNGFTLAGATAVGSGADLDELDVFDVLASLVSKSLVLAEPDRDSLRYHLLESTRVYALEKLDEAREREMVANRHLRYLAERFTEITERVERTARMAEANLEFARELEDVRMALDGALERSEIVEGSRLLFAVSADLRAAGLDAESMARIEAFLAELPEHESLLRALLSSQLAFFLGNNGQKVRAFDTARAAVAYARLAGDAPALGETLMSLGFWATVAKQLDVADAALSEAEAMPGKSLNLRLALLQARAAFGTFSGDLETAARMREQLCEEHRTLGNESAAMAHSLNLAEAEHGLGRTERAIELLREVLPWLRSTTDRIRLANALQNFAGYLAAAGDLSGAGDMARESIAIFAEREPDHVFVGVALEHLALVIALHGDLTRAAELGGFANVVLARQGFEREHTEQVSHDRLSALLRAGLSPDELSRLTAAGAALTPEAAIALSR